MGNRAKQIGCIVIREDDQNKKRAWIKVHNKPVKWIRNTRYIWTKHTNNDIPKGFILHHIDENTLNDDVDNLALLTRSAHMNIHRNKLNMIKSEQRQGKKETEFYGMIIDDCLNDYKRLLDGA